MKVVVAYDGVEHRVWATALKDMVNRVPEIVEMGMMSSGITSAELFDVLANEPHSVAQLRPVIVLCVGPRAAFEFFCGAGAALSRPFLDYDRRAVNVEHPDIGACYSVLRCEWLFGSDAGVVCIAPCMPEHMRHMTADEVNAEDMEHLQLALLKAIQTMRMSRNGGVLEVAHKKDAVLSADDMPVPVYAPQPVRRACASYLHSEIMDAVRSQGQRRWVCVLLDAASSSMDSLVLFFRVRAPDGVLGVRTVAITVLRAHVAVVTTGAVGGTERVPPHALVLKALGANDNAPAQYSRRQVSNVPRWNSSNSTQSMHARQLHTLGMTLGDAYVVDMQSLMTEACTLFEPRSRRTCCDVELECSEARFTSAVGRLAPSSNPESLQETVACMKTQLRRATVCVHTHVMTVTGAVGRHGFVAVTVQLDSSPIVDLHLYNALDELSGGMLCNTQNARVHRYAHGASVFAAVEAGLVDNDVDIVVFDSMHAYQCARNVWCTDSAAGQMTRWQTVSAAASPQDLTSVSCTGRVAVDMHLLCAERRDPLNAARMVNAYAPKLTADIVAEHAFRFALSRDMQAVDHVLTLLVLGGFVSAERLLVERRDRVAEAAFIAYVRRTQGVELHLVYAPKTRDDAAPRKTRKRTLKSAARSAGNDDEDDDVYWAGNGATGDDYDDTLRYIDTAEMMAFADDERPHVLPGADVADTVDAYAAHMLSMPQKPPPGSVELPCVFYDAVDRSESATGSGLILVPRKRGMVFAGGAALLDFRSAYPAAFADGFVTLTGQGRTCPSLQFCAMLLALRQQCDASMNMAIKQVANVFSGYVRKNWPVVGLSLVAHCRRLLEQAIEFLGLRGFTPYYGHTDSLCVGRYPPRTDESHDAFCEAVQQALDALNSEFERKHGSKFTCLRLQTMFDVFSPLSKVAWAGRRRDDVVETKALMSDNPYVPRWASEYVQALVAVLLKRRNVDEMRVELEGVVTKYNTQLVEAYFAPLQHTDAFAVSNKTHEPVQCVVSGSGTKDVMAAQLNAYMTGRGSAPYPGLVRVLIVGRAQQPVSFLPVDNTGDVYADRVHLNVGRYVHKYIMPAMKVISEGVLPPNFVLKSLQAEILRRSKSFTSKDVDRSCVMCLCKLSASAPIALCSRCSA